MSIKRTAGADDRAPSRWRRNRFLAILSVVGVLASASIVATQSTAAYAADYPSWTDVVNARHDAAKTKSAVKQIKSLIARLDKEVAATAADAQAKGDVYQQAEQVYFEAATKATELRKQANAAEKTRKQSEAQAGQLAARLARQGGDDPAISLFLSGKNADDILATMGAAGKFTEQANEIYEKAVQDKNTAQALTDQADVAAGILKKLKAAAETAFEAAQKAADAAQTALDASEAHRAELEAQLAALTTKLKLTEKQYLKGVQAKYGAGAGLGAGQISASGWAKPANGHITSGFGRRIAPIAGVLPFHSGTDIAGGCGIPIYAAHGGKVIYAGWYGTYGNFILLDNGNGTQTGYAHIVNGGILVHLGQSVGVGQNIAKTGMTGAATGCHLHFEVRRNGVAVNAVPFMRGKGIVLG